MDKLELIGRRLLDALSKARELSSIALDDQPDLRRRAAEIMKTAKNMSRKLEAMAEVHQKNGKMDEATKVTLERGLDRVLAAMEDANRELDGLLAIAKTRK